MRNLSAMHKQTCRGWQDYYICLCHFRLSACSKSLGLDHVLKQWVMGDWFASGWCYRKEHWYCSIHKIIFRILYTILCHRTSLIIRIDLIYCTFFISHDLLSDHSYTNRSSDIYELRCSLNLYSPAVYLVWLDFIRIKLSVNSVLFSPLRTSSSPRDQTKRRPLNFEREN